MHPLVWKASGHVDAFHDVMVDCKVCKHRFRYDQLQDRSQCPDCGSKGSFTEPRNFNLMMRTSVGPMEDTSSVAYLRPETAQGIFVNFKNIYQSARKRPPFGVAQIGKSFRNEITPGNFTFRLREFEQAELEYFVPDDGKDMDCVRAWVERRKAWYASYGISSERLRFYELTRRSARITRKAGVDVEYLFPWGWGELESIAHRGTYDLDAHMQLSGKDLRFFDEATKTHYTPLLIESSAGVDRTVLTFMIDAYERERSVDPNGKADRAHRAAVSPADRAGSGRGFFAGAQQTGAGGARGQHRGGAAACVSNAVRRRQHRPAVSPSRRNRHAVLRHGRLRDARRRKRDRASPRFDAAGPRRGRCVAIVSRANSRREERAGWNEVRLLFRRGSDGCRRARRSAICSEARARALPR